MGICALIVPIAMMGFGLIVVGVGLYLTGGGKTPTKRHEKQYDAERHSNYHSGV